MRQFTKTDIEMARKYFSTHEYPEVSITIGGQAFSYFELPQSLNPKLPFFAVRLTGASESDGEVYGVAESVPIKYRPFVVAHEVMEFRDRTPEKDKCVKTLERELNLVPEDIRQDYILMRMTFFRNLINFAKSTPADFTEQDVLGFEKSARRLEELVQPI